MNGDSQERTVQAVQRHRVSWLVRAWGNVFGGLQRHQLAKHRATGAQGTAHRYLPQLC